MLGDTVVSDGITYEVCWDGTSTHSLIGDRSSKHLGQWIPPKRLYNKTDREFWDGLDKDRVVPAECDPSLEIEKRRLTKGDTRDEG